MKNRNPLFVAGFPYTAFLVGYFGLQILADDFKINGPAPGTSSIVGLISAFVLMLIGGIYSLYWLIVTAKTLRRETGLKIPNAILLFIPFANYWWMWRYSQVVESYTKEKMQGVLAFILIALLGSIGMGILQDTYNKMHRSTEPKSEV
jgi:uncharacterized BrkB/YihY/UPF0761 family membrane protein